MNGPNTIYRLKPVFEIPPKLHLPSCMYTLKNPVACVTATVEHTGDHMDDEKKVLDGIMDKVKDILKIPLPELTMLEKRWDSVLEQLMDLKSQLETIKKSMAESSKLSGHTIIDSTTLNNLKVFQGAVINANPSNPPYFLLLVKHLYKLSFPFTISCHVHSSVSSASSALDNIKLFSKLENEANCEIKLLLIWKNDITDTELVINPIKQLPIKGEVNILRLLARSGLKLLQYPSEELVNTIQTDFILDVSHRLLHVQTTKEKASLYKNLNAKLGRYSYFGGDSLNISDISVWSALKQIHVNPAQDLSPTMAKWYLRMDKILF